MTTPKSNQERELFFPPNSTALRLIKELYDNKQYSGSSTFVFHPDKGPYYNRNTFAFYLKKLGKESEVRDVRAHKFRHTMATMSIRAGVDIVTVSKLLGHSSSAITARVYLHSDANNKREGLSKLGALLGNFEH